MHDVLVAVRRRCQGRPTTQVSTSTLDINASVKGDQTIEMRCCHDHVPVPATDALWPTANSISISLPETGIFVRKQG